MSEAWINFGTLLLVQLLIFVAVALYEKKTADVAHLLRNGVLIGIPFGLSFDLLLGSLLGLSSYALGFGLLFLIPNAAFSYGVFAATILLVRQRPPLYFAGVTLIVTALYETVNLFLKVWEWHLPVPSVTLPFVLAIGYVAGAVLTVQANRLFR